MGYNIATEEQESTWLHIMSSFEDSLTPQVGIFWFDVSKAEVFGVLKGLASDYIRSVVMVLIPSCINNGGRNGIVLRRLVVL